MLWDTNSPHSTLHCVVITTRPYGQVNWMGAMSPGKRQDLAFVLLCSAATFDFVYFMLGGNRTCAGLMHMLWKLACYQMGCVAIHFELITMVYPSKHCVLRFAGGCGLGRPALVENILKPFVQKVHWSGRTKSRTRKRNNFYGHLTAAGFYSWPQRDFPGAADCPNSEI